MDNMISIIISALALVISTVHACFECWQMKRINDLSLKSKYYNDVFDEYLLNRIPGGRRYIRFNDAGKLVDVNELTRALDDMMNDALFFKFDNRNFYDELKNQVKKLQDYISVNCNKCTERDEQGKVYDAISNMIEEIYKLVGSAYVGKQIKTRPNYRR